MVFSFLKELKKRRILHNLFYYSIGAVGLLASVYEISDVQKIRFLFLILCLTGAPIVAIACYFHGKRGNYPIPVMETVLMSICVLTGYGFAVRILAAPTPMTILIRMMEPQENWFIANTIKPFEETHHCKVTIRRFQKGQELCELLRSEGKKKKATNVSLAKIPLHLTLLLYKEGLVNSYEDILSDLGFGKSKIESWLESMDDEYDPVALKASRFSSITGKKLYFLPRKLETRLLIYRKSKVDDAVKNWDRFQPQISGVLKNENGYGLPKDYYLEPDASKWDFYDLFVVGYYWANTEYDRRKTPRIAHRSKNYSGTAIGLLDKSLQLGASKDDILDMYRFSDGIVDMLQWEAVFRKYNLYCKGMWQGDGWSGLNIYEGMRKEIVYLAHMHQLDCLLIRGSQDLGIKGYLSASEDFGVSTIPQGVSFELTEGGLPKRTGSRKAHTFAWFWAIPSNAPEPELAYELATLITSHDSHLEECRNFCLLPIKKRVGDALHANSKADWHAQVYAQSLEQLAMNGDCLLPRFKTLTDYQEFFARYYDGFEQIVIKQRYSLLGPTGKVDRDFIRDNVR